MSLGVCGWQASLKVMCFLQNKYLFNKAAFISNARNNPRELSQQLLRQNNGVFRSEKSHSYGLTMFGQIAIKGCKRLCFPIFPYHLKEGNYYLLFFLNDYVTVYPFYAFFLNFSICNPEKSCPPFDISPYQFKITPFGFFYPSIKNINDSFELSKNELQRTSSRKASKDISIYTLFLQNWLSFHLVRISLEATTCRLKSKQYFFVNPNMSIIKCISLIR